MKHMMRLCGSLALCLCALSLSAQPTMLPLKELLKGGDTAWPMVQEWIASARNKLAVLPVDTIRAPEALFRTQVTTRSPMGAVVYHTGGILVDGGWIRILGSGSERLERTLPGWNRGKAFTDYGQRPAYLLIADDVIGGYFILNGGRLGTDTGKVYYLSPDNLDWEPLGISYSEFLNFCFNADLDQFYKGMRWNGWEEDVARLSGDKVFHFSPPLWSKEKGDINRSARNGVPAEEQYGYTMELVGQLKKRKK